MCGWGASRRCYDCATPPTPPGQRQPSNDGQAGRTAGAGVSLQAVLSLLQSSLLPAAVSECRRSCPAASTPPSLPALALWSASVHLSPDCMQGMPERGSPGLPLIMLLSIGDAFFGARPWWSRPFNPTSTHRSAPAHIGTYALPARVDVRAHIAGYALPVRHVECPLAARAAHNGGSQRRG